MQQLGMGRNRTVYEYISGDPDTAVFYFDCGYTMNSRFEQTTEYAIFQAIEHAKSMRSSSEIIDGFNFLMGFRGCGEPFVNPDSSEAAPEYQQEVSFEKMSGDIAMKRFWENQKGFTEATVFNIDVIFNILLSVAKGIQTLHYFGIYHRGIKIDNILYRSEDENTVTIKIGDFGDSSIITDHSSDREISVWKEDDKRGLIQLVIDLLLSRMDISQRIALRYFEHLNTYYSERMSEMIRIAQDTPESNFSPLEFVENIIQTLRN